MYRPLGFLLYLIGLAGVCVGTQTNPREGYIIQFTGELGTQEARSDIQKFYNSVRELNLSFKEGHIYNKVFNGISIRELEESQSQHGPHDLNKIRYHQSNSKSKIEAIKALPFVKQVWGIKSMKAAFVQEIKAPRPVVRALTDDDKYSSQDGEDFKSDANDEDNEIPIPHPISEKTPESGIDFNRGEFSPYSEFFPWDLHKITGVERLRNEFNLTGEGIKVGIIDTGVDYMHPELGGCFKTPGCPIQYGYDFVGDDYTKAGTEKPSGDPRDTCAGHGTHVAGIIMGQGPLVRGVSPNVILGAYKVTNCKRGTINNDHIIAAIERAYEDGMDVVNISLSGEGWKEGPMAVAAEEAVKKGMLVVSADSNYGLNGLFTSGIPALGDGVLNVASYESPYIIGEGLDIFAGHKNHTVAQFPGNMTKPLDPSRDPIKLVFPEEITTTDISKIEPGSQFFGCSPFSPSADLKGKALFMVRGDCTFVEKAQNAQNAGAAAVVLANNLNDTLLAQLADEITIPFVSITKEGGDDILRIAKGSGSNDLFVKSSRLPFGTHNPRDGQISPYSSWGPDPELSLAPGITGPGGQIFSTLPINLGNYTMMSGTSMSSPYMTGIVALMLQAKKNERVSDARDLRDLLLEHAKPVKSESNDKYYATPLKQGAGFVDAYAAVKSSLLVTPTSLPLNYTINGQSITKELTINNLHKREALHVTLEHYPGESVRSFLGNGTFSLVPEVDTNGTAKVDIGQTSIVIPAGKKRTVSIDIAPPEHLKEDGRWFYGGFIIIKSSPPDRNYMYDESISIPYMGYKGDYQDLPFFSYEQKDVPYLTKNGTYTQVEEGESFDISPDFSLFLTFPTLRPTRLLKVELIDTDKDVPVGYLPYGYSEYLGYFGDLPSQYLVTVVNGVVFKDTTVSEPPVEKFKPGNYKVRISALKMFGDINKQSDYQVWESAGFSVKSVETQESVLHPSNSILSF
ncbi:hypothetical protein H4219_001615 [Mycoemilia scoparia]|uniref:Subtilisin-like protein n=1 Tax=Mycoemilia scoparia TaxID=417184 RepID=A0A9W8A907_9FUNG|nr:hypothetical protein H4219_001615 [Mycoemilia scoparia]